MLWIWKWKLSEQTPQVERNYKTSFLADWEWQERKLPPFDCFIASKYCVAGPLLMGVLVSSSTRALRQEEWMVTKIHPMLCLPGHESWWVNVLFWKWMDTFSLISAKSPSSPVESLVLCFKEHLWAPRKQARVSACVCVCVCVSSEDFLWEKTQMSLCSLNARLISVMFKSD